MSNAPRSGEFRCRDFAVRGRRSTEYNYISSLLPREAVRNAQCRDSRAAWYQHRLKFNLKLDDADLLVLACVAGLATCRMRRWANDRTGWELLSFGAFTSVCERSKVWSLLPGDPIVGFAASTRRLVVHLRSKRIRKRPTNIDHITVPTCSLFEAVVRNADLWSEFMDMISDHAFPQDVPESTRHHLAMQAARYANRKLDVVDQAVFGGITPHAPSVFDQLVSYWQECGIETLVARDALDDFQPDLFAN